MATQGITAGSQFLAQAALAYFSKTYQVKAIAESEPIDKDLKWTPSLSFKVNNHKVIAAEVSEKPYPGIFRLRHADLLALGLPVAVYSVCPEKAFLKAQQEFRELISHGYGLLTVDDAGQVTLRHKCVPLIQQIAASTFDTAIKPLPQALRGRLIESFERYTSDPPSGTADIAEVMEAMILKAGQDAVKKQWLQKGDVKPGQLSNTLTAMQAAKQFSNAKAVIGAAQGYISMYRNPAHHVPKNKAQAATKYRDCRHAFLEGLRQIAAFRDSMKQLGLTGGLPKL